MRFLADECCDGGLVRALRADGHDVLFAAESLPGAPDDDVLSAAFEGQRLLLTEDRDFGELVYRLKRPTHGVVYLRFAVADRAAKVPRLRWLLDGLAERLPGSFAVLDADRVRLRPLALEP